MTESPLVSVVVAFLDAERFLDQTVASVFGQTFADWELLLVDDGSSDGSSEAAKSFAASHPEKVFYLAHPGHRNLGVCASRNLAVRRARGQFVGILDADDVWEPNKLEEQTAVLLTYPDVGMVYGTARYWRSWRETGSRRQTDYVPALGIEPDRIHEPPSLLKRCFPLGRATAPCPSDMLLRRELIRRVNGFEEAFTGAYQMYEDQAFLAKVYLSTSIYASSRTWTRYRIHPDSCCYRVESSGAEPSVRRYYLDWLDEYLRLNDVKDASIRRALYRAKILSRNSWASRALNAPAELKALAKRLSRLARGRSVKSN